MCMESPSIQMATCTSRIPTTAESGRSRPEASSRQQRVTEDGVPAVMEVLPFQHASLFLAALHSTQPEIYSSQIAEITKSGRSHRTGSSQQSQVTVLKDSLETVVRQHRLS